jgi:hypothetical protein
MTSDKNRDEPPVQVGDRVEMRKPHPCGSTEWTVYRIGADIGLQCAGCGRRVLLARGEFNKRLKRYVERAG